ncbi:hypothetical protein KKE06_01430, partial [Candidatus Micrarchaeota archaeon]|nr:hypothetical protein [Candidatus Micrarchaeota archaeon]
MVPALKVGSRRTSRVVRGLKRKAYRVRKVARSWRSQKKNLRPLAEKIIASEVIWQRRELEKKMKGEWENSIGKIKGEIMRQQHILQRGSETERVSAHSVLRNLER